MREMVGEGFDRDLCWLDRQTNRDMREMVGEGFDRDLCWLDRQTDKQRYGRDGRRGL